MRNKLSMSKVTIRFYDSDIELIRSTFPGGYGKPGLNSIIREVIHTWVTERLIPQIQESEICNPSDQLEIEFPPEV